MQLKTKSFLDTLTAVKPGLSNQGIIEQMGHFIFTGSDIATFNDRTAIFYPFETDFKCSVNAKEFFNTIKGLKEDQFDIQLTNNELIVSTATTQAGHNISNDTMLDKPIESLLKAIGETDYTPLPEDFLYGASLCMFSASRDDTTQALTAISVNGYNIFAGDKIRISAYKMKDKMPEFLIKASSVVDLKDFKLDRYTLLDSWVVFLTEDDVAVLVKRMIGDYPNPSKFFEFETESIIDLPVELKTTLDNITLMSEGDLAFNKQIELKFSDNKVYCKAQKERGWIKKVIDCEYDGQPFVLHLNPIFLREVLDRSAVMTVGSKKVMLQTDNYKHLLAVANVEG